MRRRRPAACLAHRPYDGDHCPRCALQFELLILRDRAGQVGQMPLRFSLTRTARSPEWTRAANRSRRKRCPQPTTGTIVYAAAAASTAAAQPATRCAIASVVAIEPTASFDAFFRQFEFPFAVTSERPDVTQPAHGDEAAAARLL